MIHDFTTKSVKQLIEIRSDVISTAKFQPILSEPCAETLRQIAEELQTRGIMPIRFNHEIIKVLQ